MSSEAAQPNAIRAFDPLDWLNRAALVGYRHQIIENASGEIAGIYRAEPCCYDWAAPERPSDRDLFDSLGSTAAEIEANRAAINQTLLSTNFADRYRIDGRVGVLTYGRQPVPPGARLPGAGDVR